MIFNEEPETDDEEDHQWEDIPPDDGGGQFMKEAPSTSRVNSPKTRTSHICTGRGHRGFWLGRKAKLMNGEAPRRLKFVRGEDNTCSGGSLNTMGNRVKPRGSKAKIGLEGGKRTRAKAASTLSQTPTPD